MSQHQLSEPEDHKKKDTPDLLKQILLNAVGTTQKFEQQHAGVETRKCPNCTAARPADANLKYCDYCGFQFY